MYRCRGGRETVEELMEKYGLLLVFFVCATGLELVVLCTEYEVGSEEEKQVFARSTSY